MCKMIECDVDGVLLDIYTPVEKQYTVMYNGTPFSFEKEVKTWGMTELGNRRRTILELLEDNVLRSKAKFYAGAVDFVRNLYDVAVDRGYTLVLNTSEANYQSAYAKKKILLDLREKVGRPFKMNVQCGMYPKEMLPSDIVIEDSVPNIERSTARVKLLKNMFHNTTAYNIIKTDYIRCNDYTDIYNAVVSNIE